MEALQVWAVEPTERDSYTWPMDQLNEVHVSHYRINQYKILPQQIHICKHSSINPKQKLFIWDFPVVIEVGGLASQRVFGGRRDGGEIHHMGQVNRRHFRVASQRFLHGQAETGLGYAGSAAVHFLNLPDSLFYPSFCMSQLMSHLKSCFRRTSKTMCFCFVLNILIIMWGNAGNAMCQRL